MSYILDTSEELSINLMPNDTIEEILQCISVIVTTPKYSIPLDRSFGTDQSYLDKPIAIAKAMIISEIYEAVGRYEPRAEVTDINFTQDNVNGKLYPILEVEILDEYL